MRKGLILIFAVVGFFLTILILPNTRWAVLTQWDVLMGRWQYNASSGFSPDYGPFVRPKEATLLTPDGDEGAIVRLITPAPGDPEGEMTFGERITRLYNLVEPKHRADYWAQFARVGSQVANVASKNSKMKPKELQERQRSRELFLKGCVEGEKLDPDNAYFPLLQAAVLHAMGRLPEARSAFLRASTARTYNSYLMLEPELRLSAIDKAHGYRGERTRAWVLANVLFYHFAPIRNLTREYSKTQDPELRVAAARIGDLLMRYDETVIGIIIGRSIFARALMGQEIEPPKPVPMTAEEAVTKAEELERAVPGEQGIAKAAVAYNKLTSRTSDTEYPTPENADAVFSVGPAFSAWSLAAVLTLIPLFGIGWLKMRSPRFYAASPHLAWLLAIPLEPAFGIEQSGVLFALGSLLFLTALYPRLRKVSDIVGLVLVIPAFAYSMEYSKLLLPIAFFVGSLVITRKVWLPNFLVGVPVVIAAGVTALLWVVIAISQSGGNALFFGFFGLIGASSIVMASKPERLGEEAERSRRLLWAASVAAALMGAVFATYVFRDLAANGRVAAATEALAHEADRVREESGAFR